MMFSVSPRAESIEIDPSTDERNGRRDDDGRAPAAEKHQDHQARQRGGDHAFTDDAAEGPEEERLVTDRRDPEVGSECL